VAATRANECSSSSEFFMAPAPQPNLLRRIAEQDEIPDPLFRTARPPCNLSRRQETGAMIRNTNRGSLRLRRLVVRCVQHRREATAYSPTQVQPPHIRLPRILIKAGIMATGRHCGSPLALEPKHSDVEDSDGSPLALEPKRHCVP